MIHIKNNNQSKKIPPTKVKHLSRAILDILGHDDQVGLEVLFVGDRSITQWNNKVFGKKNPTDVIAFPFEEPDFLGSIIISTDTATIQAKEYGHSVWKEIKILLTHGILHLMGYDHIDPKDKSEMKKMERMVLKKVKKL